MEYYTYVLIDPRNDDIFYVGKGQKKRMYEHVRNVQRGRIPNGTNTKLGNKIKKILDSKHKIKYKKVFETDNGQEALNKEIELIEEIGLENLCNLTKGGDSPPSNKGKPHSEETKRKISDSHIGKKFSEEIKRKMSISHKGKILSEETRKKISKIQKGIKRSDETKRKIGQARLGKKHSEKTKRKMSENHAKYWLGKTHSEETKRKISENNVGNKGKIFSEKTKQKMSESQKGKKHSEETKRKMSISAYKRYNLEKT